MTPLQEVKAIIGADFPFELVSQKVDLPELQGEPVDISKQKCKLAAQQARQTCMQRTASRGAGGRPRHR